MRSCSIRRSLYAVLLVAVSTVVSCSVNAEEIDKNYKYEIFTSEGARFRFNKETGELEKLVIGGGGMMWVKQEVIVTDHAPTAVKPTADKSGTSATVVSKDKTFSPASCIPLPGERTQREKEKKASLPSTSIDEPAIQIFDEKDKDITDLISDEGRKNANAAITNYENKMAITQAFQIGDRITGTILVRNSGDKRLRALELTMSITVDGRSKPEEQRFLFIDKEGSISPPQPGANGKEGMPLLQKVDILSPAGVIKGSPELRITYLQFAE